MSVPSEGSAESPQTQLNRSLGSLWESHAGGRPQSINSGIAENVVTCEIGTEAATPTSAAYRTAAIAAVTRITGRRVTAFIPKHDSKTDISTETFLLERLRIRR
jgi:ribosomal protein S12